MIIKKGKFSNWLVPDKLYHGTSEHYLESILKNGLITNSGNKNSMLSSPYIYLTTSIEMAKHFAESLSYKKSSNPIILEVDSKNINADNLNFDLNISLIFCSQCLTYSESINEFNIISKLDEIKESKMLFDEPKSVEIPVMWDLNQLRCVDYLNKIGYDFNKVNKKLKIK